MKKLTILILSLSLLLPQYSEAVSSLYNLGASPFAAQIARKPGDILTILIEEEAQTTDDGQAKEEKKLDNMDFSLDKFFLPLTNIKFDEGFTKTEGTGDAPGMSLNAQKKYSGKVTRNSDLAFSSTIQVRIVEVINEDQFLVHGYRTINVNAKDTKLFISGVIRSQDINDHNQISSKLLSDAIIEIDGQVVARDLKPGLFNSLLGFLF